MSGGSLAFVVGVLIVFLLIITYIIFGSFLEKKKCAIFHETGIAIVIGFLISMLAYLYDKDDFVHMFQFNNELFFYVCLPPIIFAAGFNMRRKRFFDNIGYILLFGVLGTIVTFAVFSGLTIAIMQGNFLNYYSPHTG